jgi:PAS domain S-box-containing protein
MEFKSKLRPNTFKRFSFLDELSSIYKWVFFTNVPIIIAFIVLSKFGVFDLQPLHQTLLIFIAVTISSIYVTIRISSKKNHILIGHYTLLFGVMVFNLVWYYFEPGYDFNLNFLIALSLVGMVLIEPRITILFYVLSLSALLIIGLINGGFEYKMFYLSICTAIVISLFNRWRHRLVLKLESSRKTYQEIFNSSDVQKYILSNDLEVLDMSLHAEKYLKNQGVKDVIGKAFQEVFIPETKNCYDSFINALDECEHNGSSKFFANCAIQGSEDFVPKEFYIKKSKYFDQDVIVMDLRVNPEQKELLDHRENVTQILDNISSFVINVTYDIKERYKHHVNFVSTKVEEVMGYTVDEYISLLKSEKLDKDRHPEDKDRITAKFEQLLQTGGRRTWRYRMKVKDEWRWIEEKLILHMSANRESANLFGLIKDVTDEVVVENNLRESERRYRQIFETTLAGVFKTTIHGEILDCNPAFAKILGYEDPKEILKLKAEDIYYKVDERPEYLDKLKKNKELNNFITHLKHRDGNEVIVSNNVTLLPDENDKYTIILGTMVDITDQHHYEKQILESRLSFKNIVDQSPSSILIFTKNDLAYVNPMGEDLFHNVLKSEHKNLYEIFPKSSHQLIKDLISEAENGISSYTEIELGEGENKKRFSINVVITAYNTKPAILFILQDISLQTEYNIQKLRAEVAEETNALLQEEINRHKDTQRSLEESTSHLKALFQTTSNLYIISLDKDYNLVTFNEKFRALMDDYLGVKVNVGDQFMDIFPIEAYAEKKMSERFQRVFEGHPSNMISNFATKSGEEVFLESFISPVEIPGQQIKEIWILSHDITEQVENRRRIMQSEESNKALLHAVPDLLFKVNKEGVFTDYRPSSESNKSAFERLLNSEQIIGERVDKVIVDQEVAEEILNNVNRVLRNEEVITKNISISYDKEDGKIHFENRYAKINDDEVVIISRNVTDTVEYEHKLIESVKEKEILLKEVHHRVKNNLQVINSILNLQSSYVTDEETLQIIIESQNRIRSMSYIHESLYQTKDFSSINFYDYITNLVQNLVHSYDVTQEKTELKLDIEKVELALDQAIPCGLILNELITNALKYAYPGDKRGKITVGVWEDEGKVFIRVKDDGVGLPEGFKIDDSESLGLSLVDTLIDQIDGELILKTQSGTEFLIIFEKQEI